MPFYEYECSNCKFYVEALQKISDPPIRKCPSCKKQTMKRLVSAPVFRLKGGGWYETDFKSDQEGKRNLAGGEEAAEEEQVAGGELEARRLLLGRDPAVRRLDGRTRRRRRVPHARALASIAPTAFASRPASGAAAGAPARTPSASARPAARSTT